jgi:protein-disulfide isomerase
LEEGLVDAAVEDRDVHLDALADHLLPFHVHLVGELGRGEVIGHGGPPLSLKSGKRSFTPRGRRVNRRDNAAVSEIAATPLPRHGRIWVILALGLALAALGYALVDISTKPADPDVVRLEGIASAQRLFGGLPQEGDRLGSADAPVAIQVFNDLQCGNCRSDFLTTIPALVEGYVRPGEARLLLRHYSVAENPLELGFFGAEAAAEQGYGWQYTYLFFRNQSEAERLGIDEELMASLAGAIGELDVPEWQAYLEREGGSEGAIATTLEGYDELGTRLGIRAGQAMIVSGPRGTRTLQDAPSLAAVERAIEAVS